MSEASDSYHFRGDVSALLKAAEGSGQVPLVVASSSEWTTFLLEGLDWASVDPRLPGTVLRWMFAEDFEWSASLFVDREEVFAIREQWDGRVETTRSGAPAAAARFLERTEAELAPFVDGDAVDGDDGRRRGYGLATLLGLPAYAWLSHDRDGRPLSCLSCRLRFAAVDGGPTRCPRCGSEHHDASLALPGAESPPLVPGAGAVPSPAQARTVKRLHALHEQQLLTLRSLDDALSVAIALEDELRGGRMPFGGGSFAHWLSGLVEIDRVDGDDSALGAALLM